MTPGFDLTALLQAAPVAVASLDLQGRFVAVNKALLEASGYSAGEMIGLPFAAFLAPADEAAARESFAAIVSGERDTYRATRHYRTKSGDLREVDLLVSLVRDAGGSPSFCLAVLHDVTERASALSDAAQRARDLRLAEEALRLSEARYRALVEQSPLSVQILAADGRTLQVNGAWERLWGVTLNQIGEYNLLEDPQLVSSGVMPYIRKAFAGEAQHIPATRYDPNVTLPDRSANPDPGRWVRAVAYPVKDPDGAVREVVLVHEDITEQLRAENERRRATELLQLVVQQSGEAIVVADADGVLRVFNPEAERLHGVKGGETPQVEWPDRYRLFTLEGEPLPYEETALYRATRGALVRDSRWVVRPPNGPERTLVGSAAPLSHPDGTPAGAVLIARDDTARLAAEAERERLLNEARAAHQAIQANSRVKDEFLATLSHELRTPLNAVLGWTHILRGRNLEEPTRHALEVIERNAAAQARLIDDLLDVSRIITGKLQLQIEPVDLQTIAVAALDTLRPAADAKGVRLEAGIEQVPRLNGDAQRLQQVFWNLIANAVKFTGSGGVVSVALSADPGAIRITVADTGAGIDPEVLPFIFDRFTQGDSSSTRTQPGLGLGLAIVRYLVELHGGTVMAESAGNGAGATFRVSLPVAPAGS